MVNIFNLPRLKLNCARFFFATAVVVIWTYLCTYLQGLHDDHNTNYLISDSHNLSHPCDGQWVPIIAKLSHPTLVYF